MTDLTALAEVRVGAVDAETQVSGAPAKRFRLSFVWYDLWVGAFYDQHKRVLYACPLPCVLLEWHR